MDEPCAEQLARLLKRATALREQTSALTSHGRLYSEAEHDALNDQLRQLKSDLADFQRRCLDGESSGVEVDDMLG